MEPYRSLYPDAGLDLSNTNTLTRRVISLPTGPEVSLEGIDQIGELIRFCIKNGEKITTKFNEIGK